MDVTITGVVTGWSAEDGWGTVAAPELDGPVFVHFSAIRDQPGYRSLEVGQSVSFSWNRADQDGYRYVAVDVHSWVGVVIEFDQRSE